MIKNLTKTLIIALVITASLLSVLPFEYAYAEDPNQPLSASQVPPQASSQGSGVISKLFAFTGLPDFINSGLAILANAALSAASFILIAAGYILDVSIRLTLNIKDFVEATPEIYIVWKIIRDITGLFFIFYLLYAAIQMMTGMGKGPSYGATIKNIVIAGILINFSFFITSVAIDASNVVSQAIYNAMVPNRVVMQVNSNTGLAEIVQNSGKSDISNIFMNSLRIQSIYDAQGNKLGTNVGDPIKILMIGITGVTMMITTAASFILAAMAFIARLVILLFLLAFSSLWFAGMVIPELNKHIQKFTGALYDQLIFMPVYLLLMYVALRIINGSKLFSTGEIINQTVSMTGTNWILPYIILAVNFAIVIFILNLPLAVGLSMGGMATDWLKKGMEKWNATNVWKGISGVIGTNTIGRTASATDKYLANTRAGNSLLGRSIRSGTTGAVAASKFGGGQTWEDKARAAKERGAKSAEIHRNIDFNKAFKAAKAGQTLPTGATTLEESLKKKGSKEKLELGAKTLQNENIVKYLSSTDFKNIKEDKDNKFSEQDKKEIFAARDKVLEDTVKKPLGDKERADTIKRMLSEMDGKDLLKTKDAVLFDPDTIKNLKLSQIKAMSDEGIDPAKKNKLKTEIVALGVGNHTAFSWIDKNW